MIKRMVVALLVLLTAACNGVVKPSPQPEPQEIVFPSGFNVEVEPGIREPVRQQLDQEGGGYYLLQFAQPVDQDTRTELESVDVVLGDYVPEYAYYAYLPPGSLPALEQLLKAGTLWHAGPIPAKAKLEAELEQEVEAGPEQRFDVTVQFFAELSPAQVEELEQLVEVSGYSFGPVNIAEGTVAAADVEKILPLPFVKWVERRVPGELGGGE